MSRWLRASGGKSVQADLVVIGIDEDAQPLPEGGGRLYVGQFHFEDRELNTRAVSGQEQGHLISAFVVGDVVGHEVVDSAAHRQVTGM
jgi:hypothetical protein